MDYNNILTNELSKQSFIAMLTHDLDPPAIAQMKALELVLNNVFGEITPIQREIISQIYNSCKYMHSMITSLLETYKYEDEMKPLKYSLFDLNELVKEVFNEVNWFASDRNLCFELNLSASPLMMNADKNEIKRVLMNMILNALSFSMSGSKIIIQTQNLNSKINFTVQSRGRIIEQKRLEELFEKDISENIKFRQVGTGIGLYLSKMIVLAHKGKLIIKSDNISGNIIGFELLKQPSMLKVF